MTTYFASEFNCNALANALIASSYRFRDMYATPRFTYARTKLGDISSDLIK
jgi:hypothetical protein